MRQSPLIGAVVLVVAALCAAAAGDAPGRLPVPSHADQVKALSLIRESYKTDYALPVSKRGDLGRKLLAEASKSDSGDDSAMRYMLLVEARQAAMECGDFDLLNSVLEASSGIFAVERPELVSETITAARNARSPLASAACAPLAMELIDEALRTDDFPAAERWVAAGRDLADRSRDAALVASSKSRALDVKARAAEFAQVQKATESLKRNATDPAASLLVGKWFCFTKGDWDTGLPHLSRGSDHPLAELAKIELGHPSAAADALKAGDGWWDLAQQQKAATARSLKGKMLDRAVYWYRLAEPALSGVKAKLVAQRIADAGASPGVAAAMPPVIYLDDMTEKSAEGIHPGAWGLGKHGALQSTGKQAISVDGKKYAHGLGMNPLDQAKAVITYSLERRCATFSGAVGLNDTGRNFEGTLIFRIIGDDRELWHSEPYAGANVGTPLAFSVSVRQVATLQLVAECKGSGNNANVVWLDPKLTPASR